MKKRPGYVADLLLAGAGAGQQRFAFPAEAHGMGEAVDLAALLTGRDDALGAAEAHGDRDFDQGVLAGFQALDRLFLVQVARRAQDHDVDFRVRQSFVERYRPLAVAVALGELLGALGIAADDGVQNRIGPLQRLGVPNAHHAVADHADIHRHSPFQSFGFSSVAQRMVGMTKSAPARMPVGQREVMVFSLV